MSKPTTKADPVVGCEDPLANIKPVGFIDVESPVTTMLRTGQITITPKGQNFLPGNYKSLNDRQVMGMVKGIQEGKIYRPETVKAVLTEAHSRGLVAASS